MNINLEFYDGKKTPPTKDCDVFVVRKTEGIVLTSCVHYSARHRLFNCYSEDSVQYAYDVDGDEYFYWAYADEARAKIEERKGEC